MTSADMVQDPGDTSGILRFVPNPNFQGAISLYQRNLVNDYAVEYEAELYRQEHFPSAPSRLLCQYAFGCRDDALHASERYQWDIGTLRSFTLANGVAWKANMDIVSYMRAARRMAALTPEA